MALNINAWLMNRPRLLIKTTEIIKAIWLDSVDLSDPILIKKCDGDVVKKVQYLMRKYPELGVPTVLNTVLKEDGRLCVFKTRIAIGTVFAKKNRPIYKELAKNVLSTADHLLYELYCQGEQALNIQVRIGKSDSYFFKRLKFLRGSHPELF